MSVSTNTQQPTPTQQSGSGSNLLQVIRTAVIIIAPFALFAAMGYSAVFLRDNQDNRLLTAGIGIGVGVVGVMLLFFLLNQIIRLFPEKYHEWLMPLLFIGPAFALVFLYKIGPAVRTIYLSFFDDMTENFVGIDNYVFAFTDPVMQQALRNNVIWIIVVPIGATFFGMVIAGLADRVRFESLFKSVIFLPMAISFVAASVIWRFVYAFQPPNRPQIGVLNAVLTLFGENPIAWLIQRPMNNFALMVILIWIQTGFAMVILSAAIKEVPQDRKDAARVDGANELQVFWRIIVPSIRRTIATVVTTILILTLKVYDIVWVMTNGNFGTEVVASRMMKEIFTFRNFGRGSAIAVILLLGTIPFMIYNVRAMRSAERE